MRRWWVQERGQGTAGPRRRWAWWACASMLVAATACWGVVAWSRFGSGVALSVLAPAVTVGAALGPGWVLARRAATPPSPPCAAGLWPRPAGASSRGPAAAPCRATESRLVSRPPGPPLTVLPSLSTWQLCWAWRRSYVHLGSRVSAEGRAQLAELRRGLLDELQRRDPAAFARWFPTARAASDPARYFCRADADHGPVHEAPRTMDAVRSPAAG